MHVQNLNYCVCRPRPRPTHTSSPPLSPHNPLPLFSLSPSLSLSLPLSLFFFLSLSLFIFSLRPRFYLIKFVSRASPVLQHKIVQHPPRLCHRSSSTKHTRRGRIVVVTAYRSTTWEPNICAQLSWDFHCIQAHVQDLALFGICAVSRQFVGIYLSHHHAIVDTVINRHFTGDEPPIRTEDTWRKRPCV